MPSISNALAPGQSYDPMSSIDNSPAARAARLGISVDQLPTLGGSGTSSSGVRYGGGLGYALVPDVTNLETQSSKDIADLLNPPSVFPDTSRQAGELAAARGIPGTAAAYGTALRMTDEERLKRMALGQNMLSSAYQRTLPYALTPWQQSQIDYQNRELALRAAGVGGAGGGRGGPSIGYGGGLPSYPSPGTSSVSGGYPSPVAYPGTGPKTEIQDTRGVYPNPSAPMLPLYPGESSSFDFGNPPAPNYEGGTYASPVPYNPAIDTYNYGGDAEAGGGMGAYEGAGGLDNLINDYLNSGGYE